MRMFFKPAVYSSKSGSNFLVETVPVPVHWKQCSYGCSHPAVTSESLVAFDLRILVLIRVNDRHAECM